MWPFVQKITIVRIVLLFEGKLYSHMPYISARVRSNNDEDWNFTERKKTGMIEYPLETKPGISGGAVVVNDFIVGKTIYNRMSFLIVPFCVSF